MTTWIVLRAAGIGAYVALWLAVAWGLIASTSLVTKRVSKPTSTMFHGVVASAGLLLLAIHLSGLLLDAYMPFKPLDLVVPMRATYRTVAVTFGIVAMYAMTLVLASSWVRKHLGTKAWRAIHLLGVPAFIMALAHGVFAGTDSSRPWMFTIYVGTGLVVLFLLIVRGLTYGYRPPRPPRPERDGRPRASAVPSTSSSLQVEDSVPSRAPRQNPTQPAPYPAATVSS